MRARCHSRDTQRVAAASALGQSLRDHCPGGSWPSMAVSPSRGTRDMSGSGGGSSSGQGCHPKEATVATVSPDWEELQRGQDEPWQLHAQTLGPRPHLDPWPAVPGTKSSSRREAAGTINQLAGTKVGCPGGLCAPVPYLGPQVSAPAVTCGWQSHRGRQVPELEGVRWVAVLLAAQTHSKNNWKQLEVLLFAINVALLMCRAPLLTAVSYRVFHMEMGKRTELKELNSNRNMMLKKRIRALFLKHLAEKKLGAQVAISIQVRRSLL